MSQTPSEKGSFVQFPAHLIYGCPGLTRDDKWVLLAIMGECWTDGPYRLSYREIASIANVPVSLLSSYEEKKKGVHHEGIIDRIERVTGYIHVTVERTMNPVTGKPQGNAQSHITIDYTRIWQDNLAYCEARKQRNTSPQEPQPVSNTNKPVSTTNRLDQSENKPVSIVNEPVPITNEPVSNTNKPVSTARSEMTPYITQTITDSQDREDVAQRDALAFSDLDVFAEDDDAFAELSPQERKALDKLAHGITGEVLNEKLHDTDGRLHAIKAGAANEQPNTPSQPVVAVAAPTSPAASVSPPSSNRTAQRAAVGRNHARAQPKPQLTLQGQQVMDWYEAKRGNKPRRTPKNIECANDIAEIDDLTQEEFDDVIERLDADTWLKEHGFGIDLEEINKRIEKTLILVRRTKKQPVAVGGRQQTVGGYYYFEEGK